MSDISQRKEYQYKKTIKELQERLDELEDDCNIPYYQAISTIGNYQKVFSWLNEQEWYKNNQHLVTQYVDSFVSVDKS